MRYCIRKICRYQFDRTLCTVVLTLGYLGTARLVQSVYAVCYCFSIMPKKYKEYTKVVTTAL